MNSFAIGIDVGGSHLTTALVDVVRYDVLENTIYRSSILPNINPHSSLEILSKNISSTCSLKDYLLSGWFLKSYPDCKPVVSYNTRWIWHCSYFFFSFFGCFHFFIPKKHAGNKRKTIRRDRTTIDLLMINYFSFRS